MCKFPILALAVSHAEMGNKLINVATTEAHPPIANAFRKIGRTWHSLADLDQAQAISECVILSDSLGYQGLNARSAKETLQQRTTVLEEYQTAVKSAISKRRNIERLKASSNIRPDRVDEALEDLEEVCRLLSVMFLFANCSENISLQANKYEQILARRAEGISQNLHRALQTHKRLVTDDITTALIEHTRSSIMYDRQILRELESLRPDINNANAKAPPSKIVNGVPKPPFIPPLEDFSAKPRINSNGPTRTASPFSPALPSGIVSPGPSGRSSVSQGPLPPQSPGAGSSKSPVVPEPHQRPSPPSSATAPPIPRIASPAQPPASIRSNEPPLGGRFVDGTKSMFVKPPISSPQARQPSNLSGVPPPQSTYSGDPLSASSSVFESHPRPMSAAGNIGGANGAGAGDLDPLGQARPTYMSASVRVPTRPRLDAREAASKLANMF